MYLQILIEIALTEVDLNLKYICTCSIQILIAKAYHN
jgi:hypothetical protein